MNIKITKEQHKTLESYEYKEYLFGSQLHGIATVDSDHDYVRVITDNFYEKFTTLAKFLPNFHSWQFDDKENNIQYVWMTETQFYKNLFSGDGNMLADIVLLSGEFENPLYLCRTYKIIKGYLGVAKRDLKLHGNNEKKRFHAYRSLFMAEKLINNELPDIGDIQMLKFASNTPSKDKLFEMEVKLRVCLNNLLRKDLIQIYPNFQEENELVQIMVDGSNTKEFKY